MKNQLVEVICIAIVTTVVFIELLLLDTVFFAALACLFFLYLACKHIFNKEDADDQS